jgi:hypothetical protein
MTMHISETLEGQIAQRLFGWRCAGVDWTDAEGLWHRTPPASTTDPAATARVWQWLERQGMPLLAVEYTYGDEMITCCVVYARFQPEGTGTTWPEALCRAALALAAALEREATP